MLPVVLPTVTAHVGPQVYGEVESIRAIMDPLIATGSLTLLDDGALPATAFYSLLEAHSLGPGETECLAFAKHFADLEVVCSDDRRARNVCRSELGPSRITGTLGLLARCIAMGTVSDEAAFAAYNRMRLAGAFLPTFTLEQLKELARSQANQMPHN